MNLKFFITGIWVLSLVITWQFSKSHSDVTPSDGPLTIKQSTKGPRNSKQSVYLNRRAVNNSDPSNIDSLIASLESAKYREGNVSLLLQDRSQEDVIKFIQAIVSDEYKTGRSWALRRAEAFCALGRRDPILALDLYKELRRKYDFTYISGEQDEIISYLAEKDVTSALGYLQNNQEVFLDAHSKIFKILAKKDLKQSLALIDSIQSDGYGKFGAIRGITSTLNKSEEFVKVLDHLFLEKNLPEKYVESVIGSWCAKKPLDALVWAESFMKKENFEKRLIEYYLGQGLDIEPKAVADWAAERSEGNDKKELYDHIMYYYADQQPVLQKWFIDQPPSKEKDTHISDVLTNLGGKDELKDKLHYLGLIQSESKRKEAAIEMYKKYNLYDPENAANFINESKDLTSEEKEKLTNLSDL